jgi:hypothetical protein
MKRKGLKITLATVMCIFNLFVCFSGVMAWFAAAKRNDAQGMQIQMEGHELNMSYRVFKYSDDYKAGVEFTGRQDALELQKYDSVITSRNEHTPIILEFLLSGVSLGENLPINITTTRSQSNANAKYISNIIKLQLAPLTINSDNPNTIYTTAISSLQNEPEVIFDAGELETTYVLDNYSSYLTGTGLTLYIMMDYSEDLVSNFTSDIHDTLTTSFQNDLLSISCITNEE